MKFDAKYTDKYGGEVITVNLSQNGLDLSTNIREVEFRGRGFMELTPSCAKDDPARNHFSFCDRSPHFEDCLQEFDITFNIPLTVIVQDFPKTAILECDIHVPACDDIENDDKMSLILKYDQVQPDSPGIDRGFEFELEDIQDRLGHNAYLKCCFNCRYSAYNPYFNSVMMGDLVCFLNTRFKEVFGRGKGFQGWHEHGLNTAFVQEIHVCEHFERG